MARARSPRKPKKAVSVSPLMVHLDNKSKAYLEQAAELRRVSLSDYVRAVTVAQAQREVLAAREQTIALTSEEQLRFWQALNEPPRLTDAQRRLGLVMKGEPVVKHFRSAR